MMNCRVPSFWNVDPGSRQWSISLIGGDSAMGSFGSPVTSPQLLYHFLC